MTKSEFKKLIGKARVLQIRADAATRALYDAIEESFPDVMLSEIYSDAENATDLEEAISCYIHYGEYNPDDMWDCMLLAYEKNCNWLCLDCDGAEVDELMPALNE